MNLRVVVICSLLVLTSYLGGCTVKINVKTPETSPVRYAAAEPSSASFQIADSRTAEGKPISTGRVKTVLVNVPDEIAFLEKNLLAELQHRGITVDGNSQSAIRMDIKTLRIRNQRKGGFTPYLTFSTFAADLQVGDDTHRIAAYFKNGKMPVWSMSEVEDPCYSVPFSVLIKEIASKINRHAFGLRSSDEQVEQMAAQLNGEMEKYSFLKVLDLGYSNNPTAVPHLVKLVHHKVDKIRAAALSALGMLGATDQLDLFIQRYNTTKHDEQFMALKAIGDLNTPRGNEFIQSVKASEAYADQMIKEIVDLFI